jgi:heme-degrading monooxygenase HmoA
MSVIVTVWFMGDPERVEQLATKDRKEDIEAIAERAKDAGVIAHRFYGSEDQVMVIDEWPDEESFQRFFDAEQGTIGPMLAEAGVTSQPQVRFWRVLDTPDKVGWGA